MRISSLFLFLLVVSGLTASFAQEYPGAPECIQPLPLKIDDFTYTTEDDLRSRLSELRNELKKYPETAQVFIQVYGGRKSKSNEIELEIERVRRLSHLLGDSIYIRDMGFRVDKSFEFFIRPLPCTNYPIGVSDLRVDDVEFSDYPARRLESSDLESSVTFKPEARCAPAARAVRACYEGVTVDAFVVVDEKGRVVFSRSVDGHVLNRAHAANTAKQFNFAPYVVGGVKMSVSGTIRVVYTQPEEIVAN